MTVPVPVAVMPVAVMPVPVPVLVPVLVPILPVVVAMPMLVSHRRMIAPSYDTRLTCFDVARTRRPMYPLRMWFLSLLACDPGSYEDVRIVQASLRGVDIDRIAILGGPQGGFAELDWDGPAGESGSLPVRMRGGAVGVVLDISGDLSPNSVVPIDLSEAGTEVTLRDALGTYSGMGWSFVVGLGGSGRSLSNGRGASFGEAHFSAGIGVFAGVEWLRIRPVDDAWDSIDDTGFGPPTDSGVMF